MQDQFIINGRRLARCTCQHCGAIFFTRPAYIARGKGRFCNRACANKATAVHRSLESRFWPKVVVLEDGCWQWVGSTNSGGYGQLAGTDGRLILAHRASWEMANGPITDNSSVLHHCDHRFCVRPSHLFLGTAQDNMDDAKAKGRIATKANGRHWAAQVTASPAICAPPARCAVPAATT